VSAQSRVFDPGIDLVEDDETELLLEAVGDVIRSRGSRPLSFREGEFKAAGIPIKIVNVLFDTGALHKSYISSDLVERNREKWKDHIFPHRAVACLADQATRIETNEVIRGVLSFVGDDGITEYSGEVEAIVWTMPGMEFIVGLPDIARNYVDLLTAMLRNSDVEVNNVLETDMRPGDIRLWSEGEVEESPEEIETPVPVAFGPVLAFMETSYEDARTEYFQMLEAHVGELLSGCSKFKAILESDLCVDRFVPREWTGIQGFPPLDLQVKEDFPPFHKVRSRPINPRLYEHAKKEFDRLTAYMYRHSTSPWASPLVIAPKATKPFIRFCGDYRWLNSYVLKTQAYIPRVQYEVEKAMGFKIFLDIDMTNSFHQFPLTELSSQRLAIQSHGDWLNPYSFRKGSHQLAAISNGR